MDLLLAKILSALVLWILSLLFGLMIPFLIWRSRSGRGSRQCSGHDQLTETDALLSDEEIREHTPPPSTIWDHLKHFYKSICRYDILSAINCFCGGLFLGILLLELFPESQQQVKKVLDDANIHVDFPITEFMVASGLLLVMIIEHVVSATCGRKRTSQSYSSVRRASSSSSGVLMNCGSDSSDSSCEEVGVEVTRGRSDSLVSSESTRSLVLIAMLSIHSVFEGLALGLELSVSPLIQLFVAISVHKSVLAFGLGMRLFETLANTTVAMLCALMFCTASPLGCAVGIGITSDNQIPDNSTAPSWTTDETTTQSIDLTSLMDVSATTLASAVLECLATGTFLYVTFVEVIPSEFSHASGGGHDHAEELVGPQSPRDATQRRNANRRGDKVPVKKIYKLVIFLLGFAAVTGLQFI